MAVYRHPVIHQPDIECDTDKTIAEYISAVPCMFISAFRSDLSREENNERSECLAKDIFKSDLTYIRCRGHRTDTDGTELIEDGFFVVDNGYINDDFLKLGIEWCRKYEKKAVLISFPDMEKVNQRRLQGIVVSAYNSQGEVKERMEFTDLPFSDAEQCFAKVYGKDFSLEDTAELNTTSLERYSGMAGFVMASRRFKNKYPGLK